MSISSLTSNQKTIQEIIDSSSISKEESRNTGELGKDQFITLLVTQLQHQDPLNPVEDKEFVSQMAQFTSLEQMQNLNSSFSANKAFSLLGKYVNATVEENNTETEISGYVENVRIRKGISYVVVNGTEISIDDISEVQNSTTNSTDLSQYSEMIGKNITGKLYDSEEKNEIEVTGDIKSIYKDSSGEYAVLDNVEAEISDLGTAIELSNINYIDDYLNNNLGTEMNLEITDDFGNDIPVKATLSNYVITNDEKIIGLLNDIKISMKDIDKIA
jgi:flagellar basal-body rod modification protein FlgD